LGPSPLSAKRLRSYNYGDMKARLLALPLSALAILGGALFAAADGGQGEQASVTPAQKKYVICMWPNPCGASGSRKAALRP